MGSKTDASSGGRHRVGFHFETRFFLNFGLSFINFVRFFTENSEISVRIHNEARYSRLNLINSLIKLLLKYLVDYNLLLQLIVSYRFHTDFTPIKASSSCRRSFINGERLRIFIDVGLTRFKLKSYSRLVVQRSELNRCEIE